MPKADPRNNNPKVTAIGKPIHIYLAGPLTTGNVLRNIHTAFIEAERLMDAGYVVFIPHASAFSEIIYNQQPDYEDWMRQDFAWLSRSDILVRIPGKSAGAEREIAFAKKHKIPVFYIDELWKAHAKGFKFKSRFK